MGPASHGSLRSYRASTVAGHPDDDDLLRRICTHDQSAFRMLLARHVDRAYSLAFRILGNGADAEDVVQNSFLRVWTHRHRWEPGRAQFSTWLYRVVTNLCIDLRRRPRHQALECVSDPADEPSDALARVQISELLDEAMRSLCSQQRVAIVLSYHQGLSNAEIADVMKTTVTAVESLLKRGRHRLRTRLDQLGGC